MLPKKLVRYSINASRACSILVHLPRYYSLLVEYDWYSNHSLGVWLALPYIQTITIFDQRRRLRCET